MYTLNCSYVLFKSIVVNTENKIIEFSLLHWPKTNNKTVVYDTYVPNFPILIKFIPSITFIKLQRRVTFSNRQPVNQIMEILRGSTFF